ncbi:Y_Y_Y domain-containing protein [Algoriphagus faecimaris]|uniref:Y_Y_Y domain-containing protein n=1 Tax=Algoriphagus faecimaris TaxID=686796 RepID=A0A1G6RTK5_9BACT|nr:triple tyrosine motif-containing protein [Algoriphagus faecimaris]SDD08020.1 Y_Y_Y domain-containing protein [Algoriphagus faecimaris]
MRHRLILLILLVHSFYSFAQKPGLPFSKFYSTNEYQGGIQNFAFSQSESGLIYVANNFGLLEYDGTTWRRYSLPNSTKIRDVAIGKSGIIYVSGQAEFGYFKPDSNGSLTYHSLLEELPESKRNLEEIWNILFLNDRVIFCTFNELFIFDKDHRLDLIIDANQTFESFHFANNTTIVNDRDRGLLLLENEELIPLNFGDFFSEKILTGFIPLSNNRHLVFTRDEGIFEISPVGVKPFDSDIPDGIQLNRAKRLKNGTIAIGSQRNGLYVIDQNGKIILHLNKENGLRNSSILSLFEDLAGNLWVGHNNGITLLELSLPFRLIDQFSGLPGTGYDAYARGENLIYGTNYGLFTQKFFNDDPSEILPIPGGIGQVYQITQIENQLLSAQNDGAFEIKNNQASRIQGTQGIWNFQQLKNHPNYLISGTYSGLALFEKTDSEIKFLRKLKGFEESSRILEQDSYGDIWMAHGYKGVYRLKLSEDLQEVDAKFYGVESGLPTNLLNSVWKINNRLVFSTEYGLYQHNAETDRFEKDPTFEPYFEHNFLTTSMVEDPLGNIFYIGNDEVGVLEKKINGTYQKNHQVFNKIKAFLNDDLQNISLIGANEVLFAANEGFIWYKLDKNFNSSTPYPTLIRSVYLTGLSDSLISQGNYWENESLRYSQSTKSIPKIPYHAANLRFEASNPIPNNENTTQYQFWLEGLEPDYGGWSFRKDNAYTNLREGKYTFHVRSKNIYDQIAEEDTFSFEVLPPWYRSGLAYFIYAILAILLLYLLLKYLDSKMKKEAEQIKAAQSKVIQQKETDLRQSQAELEKLKTEKLKSEINSKNKELASATMHLINKNGFIVHTKTHLNSIIKKSKNQEVKNEIKKIIQSIEKNIAGDKEWEQFEMHFDQVHGDFMTRFKNAFPDLSPQEIKLSAYLRMNLSSKEIANLMNITIRGVEIARYRLRKKIKLERSENLQEFILKF